MYWQRGLEQRGLGILFGLTCLAVVAGCGSESADQQSEPAQQAAAEQGGPLEIGDSAPDFRLKRLDGSTLQLSELRGKVVLVDFWATWCGPCRVAMPHLQALSEEYADKLVVVGIAMDPQGKAVVAPYVTKTKLTFEIVLPDGRVQNDFGGVQYLPTTFLVDPQGRIAAKWVGLAGKEAYESAVKKSLTS